MRRLFTPRLRGSAATALIAIGILASLALGGCTSLNTPTESSKGAVDSTGTVQAELPIVSTATAEATTPASVATSTPKAATIWPEKVGTFAKNFKKPAWYPAYLPKGYKTDSIDIIEMGTKTGLVCDIVYVSGDNALLFTQGSPTDRDYEVVSAGKVAWGSAGDKADVMLEDPEDPQSPPMIIFSKGGTFIELQGDPSLAELKKVAASMVPVK